MRWLMIEWTLKKKKNMFTALMMMGFVALAFQFEFFSQVAFSYSNWLLAILILLCYYWFMWMPSIVLIIVCQYFLSKVFKDEKNETKSSVSVFKEIDNKNNN